MDTLEIRKTPQGLGQLLVRFDNGYGVSLASMISSTNAQLVVIHFDDDELDSFSIVYDTPITKDMITNPSGEELASVLFNVSLLDPRKD